MNLLILLQNNAVQGVKDGVGNATGMIKGLLPKIMDIGMKLLLVLAIVIIGWIIAKVVAGLVKKILVKVGADKLLTKMTLDEQLAKAGIKFKISTFMSKLLYWIILLGFVVSAAEIAGITALSAAVGTIVGYIPKVIMALIILVVGWWGINLLKKVLVAALDAAGVKFGKTVANIVYYFLFIVIAIMALGQLGIDTSIINDNIKTIIAGIMLALGLAFGLGGKDRAKKIVDDFNK